MKTRIAEANNVANVILWMSFALEKGSVYCLGSVDSVLPFSAANWFLQL